MKEYKIGRIVAFSARGMLARMLLCENCEKSEKIGLKVIM